jgi:hypothetical protein
MELTGRIHLVGCSQNPDHRYADQCLKHIQDGSFDPLGKAVASVAHAYISRRRLAPIPSEQIADVYKLFDQKSGGIEKVFLEVSRPSPSQPALPQPAHTLADPIRRAARCWTSSSGKCVGGSVRCESCAKPHPRGKEAVIEEATSVVVQFM